MSFSSPFSFIFLISIPAIILMYILRQKFEEREVSSIYLWEQVLKDTEANTPWQKLKKNLLLFLQILCAVLIVLCLAGPRIFYRGSGKNLIVVIDTTGSMDTKYGETTRLGAAIKKAEGDIKKGGGKFTLISCGANPEIIINSADKNEAISKLKKIKPTNSRGEIKDALSLVKALESRDNESSAIFYTDEEADLSDINGEISYFGGESNNVSLDYISFSIQDNSLKVMVRVTNRTREDLHRDISLYADGRLVDVREIEISANSSKTIYFDGASKDALSLMAEITEKDDLMEDNTIYEVVNGYEKKKALLLTNGNIFIEKAISLFSNIDLYKTSDEDDVTGKYDLYIFDGAVPKEMPKEGSIVFINPPDGNGIINIKGSSKGGRAYIEKNVVTRYIEDASFNILSMKLMDVPYWGNSLIKVDDSTAAVAGEYKGRKICALSFDLHNSDFPLSTEYPIFMYNIISYLLDLGHNSQPSIFCGDNMDISPAADVEAGNIKLPSGKEENIIISFPATSFGNTYENGIYTLLQKSRDKEIKSSFAVNFPSEYESVQKNTAKTSENSLISRSKSYGEDMELPLLIMLLFLLCAEWVVYVHGY
ncbi:MAG TPA: hypothetical protein DD426_00965 [Clostridiaceae bacterium]|nr:hypothetical protein [Clostridiaceae bacterium]